MLRQLAVAVGICLPIPLLAATGLSIPLPGSVERLAAALVPWAGPGTFDSSVQASGGKNGSIVDVPRQRGAKRAPAGAADRPRVRGERNRGATDARDRPVAKRPGVTQKPKPSTPGRAPAEQTVPAAETPPPAQQNEPVPPEVRLPTIPPAPPLPPPPLVEPILEPVRPIVEETKPIVDAVTHPLPDLNPPAIPKGGGLPGVGK